MIKFTKQGSDYQQEMDDKQFYTLFTDPDRIPDPVVLADNTVMTPLIAKKGLLTIAIQEHLDAAAKAKGYDNIHSAAIRAGFTGPFQTEGQAFATWMDACWTAAIQVFTDFENNVITELPTVEAAILALPPAPVF